MHYFFAHILHLLMLFIKYLKKKFFPRNIRFSIYTDFSLYTVSMQTWDRN